MILNDVKQLKVNDWTYLVKHRKSWYEQVQKNEPQEGLYFQYKDDTVSSSHFIVRDGGDFTPTVWFNFLPQPRK